MYIYIMGSLQVIQLISQLIYVAILLEKSLSFNSQTEKYLQLISWQIEKKIIIKYWYIFNGQNLLIHFTEYHTIHCAFDFWRKKNHPLYIFIYSSLLTSPLVIGIFHLIPTHHRFKIYFAQGEAYKILMQ